MSDQGETQSFESIESALADLDNKTTQKAADPEEVEDTADLPESSQEDSDDSEEVATEDEDGQEEEQQEEQRFTVKVNGKETQVTLEELKNGYQRNSDYAENTRKNKEIEQVLSHERQRIQAIHQHYEQNLTQLQQQAQAITQIAQAYIGQPPSLELLNQDPQEYMRQKGFYDASVQQYQGVLQQAQQLTAQHQQSLMQQQLMTLQANAAEAIKTMPELTDKEQLKKYREKALSAGEKYGFTHAELTQITDHRLLPVLRDLAEYHRMKEEQSKTREKVKNAPPKLLKAGNSQPAQNVTQKRKHAYSEFMKSNKDERAMRRYLQLAG